MAIPVKEVSLGKVTANVWVNQNDFGMFHWCPLVQIRWIMEASV